MDELDLIDELDEPIEEYNDVRFAVVDGRGDILWIGECPEDEVSLQATGTGQTVIPNPPVGITDESHYYKNSTFKPYPTRPGSWAVFNYAGEVWTDPRSADKNLEFDRQDYTVDPTYSVSGNTFSYSTFTAIRDNGTWSETKTKSGGTVTYPGKPVLIGYSWDANSVTTYNSMDAIASSPRRFLIGEFRRTGFFIPASSLVDGNNLSANTVSTTQLSPLAVTSTELALAAVGEDHLQKDSVVASKMAVTDLTNIIPDSEMKDQAAWTLPARWSRIDNPAGTGFKAPGALQYDASSVTSGYSSPAVSKRFPVEDGRDYLIKYHTFSGSGQTHGVWGRVHWFNAVGNEVGSYTTVGLDSAGAGQREARNKVSPPSDAKYAEIRFYVNQGQSTSNVQISSLICRVMSGGELIVDGGIKTNHLEAECITVDKLAVRSLENLFDGAGAKETSPFQHISSTGFWDSVTAYRGQPSIGLGANDDGYTTTRFPVNPGSEYFISFYAKKNSFWNGQTENSKLRVAVAGSNSFIDAISYASTEVSNSSWTKLSKVISLPDGVNHIVVQLKSDATQGWIRLAGFEMRLRNGGELIVDGSIKTNHLESESITTDKLGAQVVTASRLAIADFTNLVNDDQIQDSKAWVYTTTNNIMQHQPTAGHGSIKTVGCWRYVNSLNTNNNDATVYNKMYFPVTPGDVLYLSTQIYRNGGTKKRVFVQIQYFDKNDVFLSGAAYTFVSINGTANTSAPYVGEHKVPAGAFQARIRCYVYGADTDSDVYFGSPTVRIKNNAEMIVDGAIRSNHLDTNSLSVSGLSVFGGTLQSSNFNANGTGWRLRQDGTLNLANAIIKRAHIDDLQVGTEQLADRAASAVHFANSGTGNQVAAVSFTSTAKSKLVIMIALYSSSYGIYDLEITKGTTVTSEQIYLGNNLNHVTPDVNYTMISNTDGYEGTVKVKVSRVGVGFVRNITVIEAKK